MEIAQYVDKMKEIYDDFLVFIENQTDDQSDFETLKDILKAKINLDDADDIRSFLNIIINYSNFHHRNLYFFDKIEQILIFLKDNIKKNFSNQAIFNIFQKNKRILLILIEQNILNIDESIAKIISSDDFKLQKYDLFFFPEIKPFLKENLNYEITDDFYSKRKDGENDTYICKLIREDNIEEFVIFSSQANFSLKSSIRDSIFETNHLLLKKKASIIEYAAFFGSNQIVKYLASNEVELEPSLWMYAIHSNCNDLIYYLVNQKVDPPNNSYEACFKYSIKCHNNNIAQYFENNFLDTNIIRTVKERKESRYDIIEETDSYKYGESDVAYGIKYCNYHFIPSNMIDDKFSFFYLCESNNIKLVKLYLLTNQFKFQTKIIQLSFFILESSINIL